MSVNKQSLTNEASATASDVFFLSVSALSTAIKCCNIPETELNMLREPMMKTLTGIILLSTCLAAVLFPHNLAAAEDAKHQPNLNSSEQAQPIFKKIRRSSNNISSRVSQRIITPRNSKPALNQAHLIHTALPYTLSQSE